MRSARLGIPQQRTPTIVIATGRPSAHATPLAANLAQACARHARPTWVMDLAENAAPIGPLLERRSSKVPWWTSDGRPWAEQVAERRGSGPCGVLVVGAGDGTSAVEPLIHAGVGLIVLEQRPRAVRSAYALIKRVVLADPSAAERLALVVCPTYRPSKAKHVVAGLHDMVRRFLGVEIDDLDFGGVGASPAEYRLGLRLLVRRVLSRCAKVSVTSQVVAVA